ncbi:MAG: hypothetical protein ACYCWW_01750 [Deltaproteobacteria bacterium]
MAGFGCGPGGALVTGGGGAGSSVGGSTGAGGGGDAGVLSPPTGGGVHGPTGATGATGPLDAGAPDAGAPKDGGSDGGSAVADAGSDAGARDGGAADAGATDAGPVLGPPISADGWTFYGAGQGLSATITDVSPDEAGNVYVAGRDALYVKARGAQTFQRFGPAAGFTPNCNQALTQVCPIISVAGGGAGQVFVGLQGIGTDDDNDPLWEQQSGGVDEMAFDGTTLKKSRHVLIATPPGVVSESPMTMQYGRRKGRQVFRVVFNHYQGLNYGDVWMGGTHVGFSVLFGNPSAEGWQDYPNQYPDSRGVWEHDHPAVETSAGDIETGDYYAIAIDPITGDPWAANEYRAASKGGYGSGPGTMWNELWPAYDQQNQLGSYLDLWPDGAEYDIDNPLWKDNTEAMTFCPDGTQYFGSSTLGIAVRSPKGQLSYVQLPPGYGNSVYALACDPTDHSVWVGLGWGGIARLHPDGSFSFMPQNLTAPAFTQQAVRSIQIDSWASPRIVYFAHLATAGGPGGGVTAYDGP